MPSNITDADLLKEQPLMHQLLLLLIVTLSTPGVFLNLIICRLTFSTHVKGEHKWFNLHLAVLDIVYCLSNDIHSYFMIFRSAYTGWFCNCSAILHYYCVLIVVVALLPVSFNRLCCLKYSNVYRAISSRAGIAATMAACHCFSLAILMPYPFHFAGFERYVFAFACDFQLPNTMAAQIAVFTIFGVLPVVFIILLLSNMQIVRVIRERRKVIKPGDYHEVNRLKEINSLIRANMLQALVPLLVQAPYLTMMALMMARWEFTVTFETFIVFLHSINPIADALVTLRVVKPYQKAFKEWMIDLLHIERAAIVLQTKLPATEGIGRHGLRKQEASVHGHKVASRGHVIPAPHY